MISKRLVSLISDQVIDPWQCPIDSVVSDMDTALDAAIGNDGSIDGVFYLKADHEIKDTGKLFPVYQSIIKMEIRGKTVAICIGKVASISVKKGWAEILLNNANGSQYIVLPTDAEDFKMSDMLLRKRGYVVR